MKSRITRARTRKIEGMADELYTQLLAFEKLPDEQKTLFVEYLQYNILNKPVTDELVRLLREREEKKK